MNFHYQTISPKSIKVNRILTCISSVKYLTAYIIGIICAITFDWNEWIGRGFIALFLVRIIRMLFIIFISSPLLYKHSKFAFNEEFVSIHTGTLTTIHMIIPMSKIQGIMTEQNMTMARYDLKSISIATMNGLSEIPFLNRADAESLQQQIATLAKVKEIE